MKKQVKVLAALSATALMTAVAPTMMINLSQTDKNNVHTVYAAATGWVEEDGTYRYIDADGYYASDVWKKHGDHWYYLNSDGYLEQNAAVDEYYVNEKGQRVIDQWISVENTENWDTPDAPEMYYYYYGKDGKAIVSKFHTIAGKKYYFNEEGHMETGRVEVDGATYYLGDANDGAMKTGWIQLEEYTENPDDTSAWYYFENNGKMIENMVDKKINGHYYTFVDGKMQSGWVKVSENTATASNASSVEGYQYYEEDGKRASGWKTIAGAPDISEEETLYSFYFKNGKPYHASTGVQIFNVDTKRYGFNTKGEMQTGLQEVTLEDGTTVNSYFGTDGVMRTGKQTIYNEDLDKNQVWYFGTDGSKKGHGFHGIRDNSIYVNGLRQEADPELRYEAVSFEDNMYLVNTTGAIQKAGSSSKSEAKPELGAGFRDLRDTNEKVWTVDTNGIIQN